MKILYAVSEVVPFYKTGGLADVAGALPGALNDAGDDVRVVAPYYPDLFPEKYRDDLLDLRWFTVWINHRHEYVGVKSLRLDDVIYYFIDNRGYFGGNQLYGYWNDGERFAFFQLAVIELMQQIDFIPDVLHSNDWHTAMIPALLKTRFAWQKPLAKIKTLLTIHNIQFQGIYAPDTLQTFFDLDWNLFASGEGEFDGLSNWLKTGFVFADAINTVSPTYAQEIQTPTFGEHLDGVLRLYADKLSGIINGVDIKRYNPEIDEVLPANFTREDMTGKSLDKRAMQIEMNLPVSDGPLFVMVSRLTVQKGVDLLIEALPDFLRQQPSAQVIVLGTGDVALERQLTNLAKAWPNQLRIIINFDVQLAQRLYGAADVFLMPSAFEPSGISQMMSQLYGTLPLVHEIGGLADTVMPYNELTGAGNGFGFRQYDSDTLLKTMLYAVNVYLNTPDAWAKLQAQAMHVDVAWTKSAQKYHELYEHLVSE